MVTFREKVRVFWDWFKTNEEKIHDFILDPKKYDPDEMTDLVTKGVKNVLEDAYFEFGGQNEFSFSTGGKYYLFYLLPYLVSQAPQDLKYKWIFSPYKLGGVADDFGFRMGDTTVTIKDIDISVGYDKQKNLFYIRYYNDIMAKIPEKQCSSMFFILLDSALGENIVEMYVGPIERLESPVDNMISMSTLRSYIENKLKENKREMFLNPSDVFTGYEVEPIEGGELRNDIYVGITCYYELIDDYYKKNTEIMDKFYKCGAKTAFLVYEYKDEDPKQTINIRNEMMDRIEAEVLGKKDSGNEIGMILGGAMGISCAYIDLLLYDENEFLKKIRSVTDDYHYKIYYSEFKHESVLIKLFDDPNEELEN